MGERRAFDLPRISRACAAVQSGIRCAMDGDDASVVGGALRELTDALRPLGVTSPAEMVAEFHAALGQNFGDGGRGPELQMRLFTEELIELRDELETDNRVGIARELFDIVYIAYSAAFSYGIDLDAVGQVVHAANMSKRGPDGWFTLREDGKILKGESFRPPDVASVVGQQPTA